jgi:hypothetical protein
MLSRGVRTSEEHQIPNDIAMLLAWWYEGRPVENTEISPFNQQQFFLLAKAVVPMYNQSVRCSSLRNAIIGVIGRIKSPGQSTVEVENLDAAITELRRKEPAKWEAGDVLAVALLAFAAPRNRSGQEAWKIHAGGFQAALEQLSPSQCNTLKGYWALARDFVIGFHRWDLHDSDFFRVLHYCSCRMSEYMFQARRDLAPYQGSLFELDLHMELLARAIRTKICDGDHTIVTQSVKCVEQDLRRMSDEDCAFTKTSPTNDLGELKLGVRYWMCKLLVHFFDVCHSERGFNEDGPSNITHTVVLFNFVSMQMNVELSSVYPVRQAIGLVLLAVARQPDCRELDTRSRFYR